MSHFSRIKTQFRNHDALVASLVELGFDVRTGTTIQGHRGQVNVDLAAKNRFGHEIGFVKNSDGSFDMVGDWWGKGGFREAELARTLQRQAGKIQQEYSRRIVLEETQREGFSVIQQVEDEDGTLRIVVRRWVS